MKQYFTEQEVQEFKDGSINYPFITFDKKEDEVLEVSEVTSIGGMATNNGTPTRITVRVHRKGELDKLLTYTLDNEEVLPTTTFNTKEK